MASTRSAGRPTSASDAATVILRELLGRLWWMPRADARCTVAEQVLLPWLLGGLISTRTGPQRRREHLAVAVGDVLVLVEVGQAHHVPLHVDVTDLLDLAGSSAR